MSSLMSATATLIDQRNKGVTEASSFSPVCPVRHIVDQSQMLSATCPDLHHQNSFNIKQDDKFFSKLLSKEASNANPSFRIYYGDVSSAVPFTWETRPGTPKHTFSDASLPPLTPPPAYYFRSPKENATKHPRSKLLKALLMRITARKKSHVPLSPSCSSSLSSLSWSSSHSSTFSAGAMTRNSNFHGRRGFSSCGSSFTNDRGDEHQEIPGGPSTFCFGLRRGKRSLAPRGGNSATSMKKTLLSIIGHGSD